MFYATRIQSVGNGYAIDVQGKNLLFIGYLPVKAGDTVYTDGKVIFGNAPPKGSPMIIDDGGGGEVIPVLSNNLRGYFSLTGKYKKFKIAGKYWIVNHKNSYYHDLGSGVIIDAEIALDENGNECGLYTVSKVITQSGSTNNDLDSVAYDDKFYCLEGRRYRMGLFRERYDDDAKEQNFYLSHDSCDYSMFDDDIKKDCNIFVYRNNQLISTINLKSLVKSFEDISKEYAYVDMPMLDIQDHIKSRARVENFKVNPDGSWVALIFTETFAERDAKEKANQITNYYTHSTTNTNEYPISNPDFPWGGTPDEIAQAFRNIGCIYVTADDIRNNSAFAQSFFNLFYNMRKPTKIRVTTTSYASTVVTRGETYFTENLSTYDTCLFKISSDGSIEKLFEKRIFSELVIFDRHVENFGTPIDERDVPRDKKTFPYIDSVYTLSTADGNEITLDMYGGLYGMYIIDTISYGAAHNTFNIIGYNYISDNLPDADTRKKGILEVLPSFTFPVQDGYFVKLINFNQQNCWQFGGVFDKDGNPIIPAVSSGDDAHQWNMSLVPLKKGYGHLLGINGKNLYKVNAEGQFNQEGTGLKNFRLRVLKNLNKAKK